jgi:hypothetical protein
MEMVSRLLARKIVATYALYRANCFPFRSGCGARELSKAQTNENMNWEALEDVLVALIMGGVGGSITGAVVAHHLAKKRDAANRQELRILKREDRIREFLGFMSQFRSWAERSSHEERGQQFRNRVHPFRAETTKIKDDVDISKRAEFDERVTALCRLTDSQVSELSRENGEVKDTGRIVLCSAIDRVAELVQ